MGGGEVSAYVCVCVVVYNQCLYNGGGSKSVSLQSTSQGYYPTATLAEAAAQGSQKRYD